jgi:uncharacterized glyoxalase superfamily protein PhnB
MAGTPAGVPTPPPAHGAHRRVEILMPPTDQEYGSRDYTARDAEGNVWSFGTYAPESAD